MEFRWESQITNFHGGLYSSIAYTASRRGRTLSLAGVCSDPKSFHMRVRTSTRLDQVLNEAGTAVRRKVT